MSKKTAKVADLNVVRYKITDLQPHPHNPRLHSQEQYQRLQRSIEDYSYAKGSIVCQKGTKTILAGHGIWTALKEEGYTEVDVIEVDFPEGIAEAFMVADNRLGDLSDWDNVELDVVLAQLKNMADIDIEMTGFDIQELESH